MPVSNEKARALAERVWSTDLTPTNVPELAEALLDVLARVAELQDWKRLAELERAEGLTQLDKAQTRVAELEYLRGSAVEDAMQAEARVGELEGLLRTSVETNSNLIAQIADKSGEGGS